MNETNTMVVLGTRIEVVDAKARTDIGELKTDIALKQDALTAGTGISIVDGVISINLPRAEEVAF